MNGWSCESQQRDLCQNFGTITDLPSHTSSLKLRTVNHISRFLPAYLPLTSGVLRAVEIVYDCPRYASLPISLALISPSNSKTTPRRTSTLTPNGDMLYCPYHHRGLAMRHVRAVRMGGKTGYGVCEEGEDGKVTWYTYAYTDRHTASRIAEATMILGHNFHVRCSHAHPVTLKA